MHLLRKMHLVSIIRFKARKKHLRTQVLFSMKRTYGA